MPTVWQPDFQPLTKEQLLHATDSERAAYGEFLTLQTALSSPLDYAMYVSSDTEEYEHIVLLNTLIVALVEHRLYSQEFGACPHPTATAPNGRVLNSGHPVYYGPDAPVGLIHEEDRATIYWGAECHVPDGTMPLDRLFVTMPPRHGKSYLISEHLAPWFLSRYPSRNILLASYEADFAASWGKKAKDHVQAHPEFGIRTDPESQAKANWKLYGDRGGMNTAGVGGPITGKGGTIIVDDPIKNDEEAMSEVDREKKYNWLTATAITRMEPGDVLIMVHTRWHEDDVGGRVMRKEPHRWYHIDLPALQPDTDVERDPDTGDVLVTPKNPLGRIEGAALCPARYDEPYLNGLRESMGNYWFSALYQQKPTAAGKGIFKRHDFRYWRPQAGRFNTGVPDPLNSVYVMLEGTEERYALKNQCRHFMTVDLAASTKTSADFTVFATWALTPQADLLLLDVERERMESADHMERLQTYFDRQSKLYDVLYVGVEKATFGLTLIKTALRKGLPVRPLNPDKDKVTRAIPAGAMTEAHKAFFPLQAAWLPDFEEELVAFDKAAHDDQVDVFAYAAWQVQRGGFAAFTAPKPEETTLEARLSRHLKRKAGKGRHFQHPELGRIT